MNQREKEQRAARRFLILVAFLIVVLIAVIYLLFFRIRDISLDMAYDKTSSIFGIGKMTQENGRAESFASQNKVGYAALDGLFMGVGFMLGLMVMALVREVLGLGQFFGIELWTGFSIGMLTTSAGGFLVFGLLIAAFVAASNAIANKMKRKQKALAVQKVAEEQQKQSAPQKIEEVVAETEVK